VNVEDESVNHYWEDQQTDQSCNEMLYNNPLQYHNIHQYITANQLYYSSTKFRLQRITGTGASQLAE